MSSLVKSKQRVQDHGEVFTPDFLVEEMLDIFPEDAWLPEKNWLEPSCGNGNFILGVLRRKLSYGHSLEQALNTTFGVDILIDNIKECHARIYSRIVYPYWKEHGRINRVRVISLVEHNVCWTPDSLTEKFDQWIHFEDEPEHRKAAARERIKRVLMVIDGREHSALTNKIDRRIAEEAAVLSLKSKKAS